MKLKFLFFPMSLAVAVTLTIWFIWPTWFDETTGIAKIQQDVAEKKAELESVVVKKNNLNGLTASMNENAGTNKNFTLRYYPETEKNEIVVNEINQFAKNSNVIVSNVGVETTVGVAARAARMKSPCLAVGAAATASGARARREGAAKVTIEESTPEIVTMFVEILGDYNGVKNFLTSVYGMEMLNNVSAISIERAEGDIGVEEGSNDLKANLVLCFGFLPESKVSLEGDFLEHPIFRESSFDFSYVTKLREMITKATSDIVIGQTSKSNPFVR